MSSEHNRTTVYLNSWTGVAYTRPSQPVFACGVGSRLCDFYFSLGNYGMVEGFWGKRVRFL